MSQKQTSKRRRRKKTVAVLGAAGVLSLAGGASAAVVAPAADTLKADTASRHVITLSEEEIFDVSLATFYVYDKENSRTRLAGPTGKGCGRRQGLWQAAARAAATAARAAAAEEVAVAWRRLRRRRWGAAAEVAAAAAVAEAAPEEAAACRLAASRSAAERSLREPSGQGVGRAGKMARRFHRLRPERRTLARRLGEENRHLLGPPRRQRGGVGCALFSTRSRPTCWRLE